ncbi:HAMP domain-containing histidine kinase [Deinococcus sp. KSM4-11]|uniref:sensor histidine kinase n=1 Tax=Deinococcus sp. KSM4-11 TaxID=2568654 RepID=UPI0010A2AC71|nr:HAMP domain-containing sensor histidine kinase [Deinococcus sp. KSM4-11]THF84794.1 HAMP domain-containing histidine kinase [Deinococcus sp. KSM4-11]
MTLTLRARLALWAALATALAVALVAGGLYYAVNGLLERSQLDRTLSAASAAQERVESLLGIHRDDPFDLGSLGSVDSALSFTLPTQADLERIADADGQRTGVELRLVGLVGGSLSSVATPRFPQQGVPVNLRPGQYRLVEQLIVVRPLRGSQALLTVASDARALGAARQAFTQVLVWLLPLTLLLTLAIGWTVAGRLLRPVRALEHAAQEIGSGGDLRRPLPGAGDRDELARLAGTLQASFHRLADARDREQAFLRAAAHDLRSPLAALTVRVDGALARDRDAERYRADLREIGTDITRLSQLANHLLLLARDPAALGRAPVPLRDLAADAVDRARELAPEADVDLDAPHAVTVPGDRVLLGQAIWNLTMNAVRHAPGATVTVTVDGHPGGARITVHDDGPGVSADVLARLGEAFYRPSESRSGDGHGLGLALARRAAELHGGTLTLASAPGQGFTATLDVPVTAPSPTVTAPLRA